MIQVGHVTRRFITMFATDVARMLCDGTMCSVWKARCRWC